MAPIVLFVYNRPFHTEQTLEALNRNLLADQSTLYIYADGPNEWADQEDREKIAATRNILRKKKWCGNTIIVESSANKGLAASIVEGVTAVLSEHGEVIVLEDDIITSPGFLKFMNEALSLYKNNDRVFHISGYIYPYNNLLQRQLKDETLFLNILSCWGWATWKRAWNSYNGDALFHLNHWANNQKKFNIEGNAHFYKQLQLNVSGEINSWAVKWYASWLMQNGFSLFPAKSLVRNAGMDGSGVHSGVVDYYATETSDFIEVQQIPIVENKRIRSSINDSFKNIFGEIHRYTTWYYKLSNKIKSFIKRVFIKTASSPFKWLLDRELEARAGNLYSTSLGKNVKLYAPYQINDAGIGDYTYVAKHSNISQTTIGKFCSIGPNFFCGWGIHPINGISTSPMFYSKLKQNGITLSNFNKVKERKSVSIGNDVFIGANVTVLDGVTIGNGAVIGAGSVVSKDIPPYSIAVGCPIKIIGYRFNDKQIEGLMQIQWWNFDDEKLQEVEKLFFKVDDFINAYIKQREVVE